MHRLSALLIHTSLFYTKGSLCIYRTIPCTKCICAMLSMPFSSGQLKKNQFKNIHLLIWWRSTYCDRAETLNEVHLTTNDTRDHLVLMVQMVYISNQRIKRKAGSMRWAKIRSSYFISPWSVWSFRMDFCIFELLPKLCPCNTTSFVW